LRKGKKLGEIRMEQLKRQQTIRPIIGYTVADYCLDRFHLKDEICDLLRSRRSCTAANNLRWLPRVIVRKGLWFFCASASHRATDTHAEHIRRGWEQERRSQFLFAVYSTAWA